MRGALTALLVAFAAGCTPEFEATTPAAAEPRTVSAWPEYGGGHGARYADLDGITPANVAALEPVWVHRHGDVSNATAFEVTPILAGGRLVFCTPHNRVLALDPLTGGELWTFDPQVNLAGRYANQLVCRGVAQWQNPDPAAGACAHTIFTGTNDGFLIALDAGTGQPCAAFGSAGRVDLNRGPGAQAWAGEYQVTSPPAVIGNVVVVGSAVSDNQRLDAPSGVVRAFDAATGAPVWAWDLAPPGFDYTAPDALVSEEGFALGTPNVWGPMTADAERDLLFVPTGNPAPDYYRTGEPDMDHYGSAVVALRGSTGEVVWHFNTVRNDFWDYDVGAQPALAELDLGDGPVPALVQGTKMGFVFVLHRDTGAPLVDYELQRVPREGPLARQLSPVQPVPPAAFRVAAEVGVADAWGLTFWDEGRCREVLEGMRTGPIYTPVTEAWTVVAPGNAGGINWDGVAVDPERGLVVARSTNLPFQVRLIPRADFQQASGRKFELEFGPQRGVDFAMARAPLLSPWGLPCTAPPWGTVTAIDVAAATRRWQVPHGTISDLTPVVPLAWELGVPGVGGPLVTRSGLVFIGGAMDNVLRAFDVATGETLWQHALPAGPQASPMSYAVTLGDGSTRQIVVIAAGGHARMGTTLGDYLIAFALPE